MATTKSLTEDFFITDALTDAIFSLEMVRQLVVNCHENPLYWKWVIITLHNAVQGFMGIALCFTNGTAVIKDRTNKKRHIRAYINDTETKVPNMWEFLNLYDLIQDPRYMCRLYNARRYQATQVQTEHIKNLNSLRNELMHFFPNVNICRDPISWEPLFKTALGLIGFLCFESNTIFFSHEENHKRRIQDLLDQISSILSQNKRSSLAS